MLSIIITVTTTSPAAGDAEKEKSIKAFRASFAQHPYRYHSLDTRLSAQECLAQLTADGIFSGLREQEEQFRKENAFQKPYSNPQAEIGLFVRMLQPYLESSGCLS